MSKIFIKYFFILTVNKLVAVVLVRVNNKTNKGTNKGKVKVLSETKLSSTYFV